MFSFTYSSWCMEKEEIEGRSASRIVPVVLAAGDSRRMGYPKALLPIGDDVFLTRILKTAAAVGLARPVIVLGRSADAIMPIIQGFSAGICINPDPDRGQLSSIQLGLSSVGDKAEAAMIWPVDQPAVSVDLVRGLMLAFERTEALIVLPKYHGKRGHPAIFHRSLFREFMDAPLEQGPKGILLRHQRETLEFPSDEPGTVEDVDTPSQYETLTGTKLELLFPNERDS